MIFVYLPVLPDPRSHTLSCLGFNFFFFLMAKEATQRTQKLKKKRLRKKARTIRFTHKTNPTNLCIVKSVDDKGFSAVVMR